MHYYFLVTASREEFDLRRIRWGFEWAWKSTQLLYPTGFVEPTFSLIHGAAPGGDTVAASLARELGWQVLPYPADWRTHGRAAGSLRNQQMVDVLLQFTQDPDSVGVCVAFPKKGSVGTWDCVKRAQRHFPVFLCPGA